MNRRTLAALVAATMCVAIVGPAAAGKKKAGPMVVFEDPANDSGHPAAAGPIPGTENGGFDLVSGSIETKGKDLVFTVEHSTAMPNFDAFPEGFRLMWHFNSGGDEYRFTVKSFDIGKPDVQAGSGTERIGTVYTDGVYRLEQCAEEPTPAITFIHCNTVEDGYLEGAFEGAKVSWTVPMALIGAKKGTLIAGGTTAAASSQCQICWVAHYAERSLTPYTIIDNATQTGIYKIP